MFERGFPHKFPYVSFRGFSHKNCHDVQDNSSYFPMFYKWFPWISQGLVWRFPHHGPPGVQRRKKSRNFARKYGEEIDLLSFSHRTMDHISDAPAQLTTPPDDGVLVAEGWCWGDFGDVFIWFLLDLVGNLGGWSLWDNSTSKMVKECLGYNTTFMGCTRFSGIVIGCYWKIERLLNYGKWNFMR